jgi:hypothetical protein
MLLPSLNKADSIQNVKQLAYRIMLRLEAVRIGIGLIYFADFIAFLKSCIKGDCLLLYSKMVVIFINTM